MEATKIPKTPTRSPKMKKNIDMFRHQNLQISSIWGPQGVPEHTGGTNMDEKDMPDPFQALPGAKTALKHRKIMVLMVKIGFNFFKKFTFFS